MDYAKTTRDELDKAIAGKPNEFKEAVESLIANSEKLVKGAEKARADLEEVLAETENVANNCLGLTRIIKDIHIWLGSVRDNFPEDDKHFPEYENILLGLAKFAVSPQAIKAGVLENARSDKDA